MTRAIEVLPSDQCAARAEQFAREGLQSLNRAAIRARLEETDRNTVEIVCDVLRRLGAFTALQPEAPIDGILRSMRVALPYQKLVRRWVVDLAEAGILSRHGNRIHAGRLYEIPAPSDGSREAQAVTIVIDVVTGMRHVLEYVYGERRPDWFAAYTAASYDDNEVFRYLHGIVAEIVACRVGRATPEQPLRILEVGAGTGSMTAALLPHLKPGASHYSYTDVARAFIPGARKRFRAFGELISFGVYDMNRDPIANNVTPACFDMVVAFDVLHCARDVSKTLDGVIALLRPGGVLINEQLTRNRLGHLLLPGIIPGFTDFEDERLQTCRTLLTPAQWKEKLSAAGFVSCCFYPDDELVVDDLGQAVIVATKP